MAKIDEWATQAEEKALASQLAKINPILALIKTIASYTLLQGKIEVDDPGAGSDLTDISLAGLGILTGGSDAVVGGATLVAEFLNRAKWANKTKYVLGVKDWTNAKVLGDVMLHFKSRAPLGGDALIQDQLIEVHDVIMLAIGQPVGVPTLTPEQMRYLTPDQLAKVKAAMAMQRPQTPTMYIIDPKYTTMGTASLNDMDRGFVSTESWTGGSEARFTGKGFSNTGPTLANFTIAIDLTAKKAIVLGASLGDVAHRKHLNGSDEGTSETVRSGYGHDFNVSFTTMIRADTTENAVPVTVEHPDAKTTVYHGSRTIKVDNGDRHASLEVSFTIRVRG
ncbi:hypothetical protein BH11ARM2_BH11ARM2_07090 [soil metagenome]